jgi:hypothetical protein
MLTDPSQILKLTGIQPSMLINLKDWIRKGVGIKGDPRNQKMEL